MESKKDWLKVAYDPARAAPEDFLRVVSEQGFQGKVVAGPTEISASRERERPEGSGRSRSRLAKAPTARGPDA